MQKKHLSGGQLAGGNSTSKKADNDFYTTDPKSVEIFLDRYIADGENLSGTIYECACGTGNITNVLKKYYPDNNIISTDLVQYKEYYGVLDFIAHDFGDYKFDTIITNPPFGLLNEFIEKGIDSTNRYLIYFAKIQTLEGVDRVGHLENTPLKFVYINRKRQATWKNDEPLNPETGKKWATTTMMAWFVWDKEYTGEPIIRFL